ncbi:MAG: hypothetical protein ABI840_02260 [bacterium]
MDLKLKELLSTINDRFSGPQSCNMHDMIYGKIAFDDEKITSYLTSLRDFGGMYGNYSKQIDRIDASQYLNLFTEYINERNKKKI